MMHDLNRCAEISAKSLRFTVGADERRLLLQRKNVKTSCRLKKRPDKKSRFFYSWVVYHIIYKHWVPFTRFSFDAFFVEICTYIH